MRVQLSRPLPRYSDAVSRYTAHTTCYAAVRVRGEEGNPVVSFRACDCIFGERHIYFLKDRSGLEAALSAPCPCDALREERDRYMTLAEVREIKADRLRVENMRLKSQLAAAVEAHRQAEAECDTAIRTRNLAQAASTRDLEAKRAAEVTLISCAGENDQLRADLATAAQGTIKALDT